MLPTFILAGVEKSGSTSLYHYLSQHPDVFMTTPKEPNFFLGSGPVYKESAYRSLFDGARSDQARGEASVGYMNDPQTAPRIRTLVPDVDIIVILRHPAERAYSHYNMLVGSGAIPNVPYIDALREAERNGNFVNTGIPTSHYYESLKKFTEVFGERLHVHFFEDLKTAPMGILRSIFRQIDVDPSFAPDLSEAHNRSYRPKNDWLHVILHESRHWKTTVKALLPERIVRPLRRLLGRANRASVPPLPEEARALVTEVLRDDIRRTEDLLRVDLSHWRKASSSTVSDPSTP